jgi:hypothetical protein
MYEARIERDSITQYGERLTTVVCTLPRIVLAELNTHRLFSRSSASSRAIPVQKQIERLRQDPFIPVYWGKNQKGMQADEELDYAQVAEALDVWSAARDQAVGSAEALMDIGVHKQITNRLLEPFMWHTVIITATEWSNFDHLRIHKDAQPEIRRAAEMIFEVRQASKPKLLREGEWHLPFEPVDGSMRIDAHSMKERIYLSVGRSARVSYLNHDGVSDPSADIALATRCLAGHMGPWEHVARPMTGYEREIFGRPRWFAEPSTDPFGEDLSWEQGERQYFLGNFNGWVQARKLIHGEEDIQAFER